MTKLRTKTNKNILVADTLVVDRSRWVMGDFSSAGSARMLNIKGNMCCLGFMCAAAGFGAEDLKNQYYPEDVLQSCNKREDRFWDIPYLTVGDRGRTSQFAAAAANINDNRMPTLEQRETRLKAHFKTEGIKLTFKGKYPEAVLKEEKRRHGGQG